MSKFTINREMFDAEEFKALMASGGGRRLWVTYKDGGHYFKVESIPKQEVVLETLSLGEAIRAFNEY